MQRFANSSPSARPSRLAFFVLGAVALVGGLSLTLASPAAAVKPQYEAAYVNGITVTIEAIDLPQVAPPQAQRDFYQVVYPTTVPLGDFQSLDQSLGIVLQPQCAPCDHEGDGIDAVDFHDHVLAGMPSGPGGAYTPLWHVFLVLPAYTGVKAHDDAVTTAYALQLPATSVAAVDALESTLVDGLPVAVEIDTHFYFLCAVVNANAAR